MDEQEKLFFKIEDYLQGKLPPAEAQEFEKDIAADPELAAAVKKHRFEQQGLEYLLEQELREKMQAWKAEDSGASRPPRPRRPWWLLGLFALLAAGLFIYLKKKPEPSLLTPPAIEETPTGTSETPADEAPAAPAGPVAEVPSSSTKPEAPAPRTAAPPDARAEQILAFHELPEHYQGQVRSATPPPSPTALDAALKAYEAGRYAEAIQLLRSGEMSDDGRELLAHAYLKQGEYAQAARLFREMAQAGYSAPVQDRMEWNLLLSLLLRQPSGNAETQALLKKMAAPENYHDYQAKARELAALLKLKLGE
jgi:anti-sigma factor RsiW